MARTAQTQRLTLDLSPTKAEKWTAYATAHGLTLGRMITACVERCIAEDGTEEDTPDQPVSSDVQNG